MIIILLGAPGVGKGTLAQALEHEGVAKQVSTCDLFRKEMANGTEIGKRVKDILAGGHLVDDDTVLKLVAKQVDGDVILDGYPRTLKQAEELDVLLEKQGVQVDLVLNLFADEETIIDRITHREICSKCHTIYNTKYAPSRESGICNRCKGQLIHRTEDNPETVKVRLEVYAEKTKPLLEHYSKRCIVLGVDSRRENAVEY